MNRRARLAALLLLAGTGAGALFVGGRLRERVRAAASPDARRRERFREVRFVPATAGAPGRETGDGTTDAVARAGSVLVTGGGSGLAADDRAFDVASGLASLRVSAVASWRGTPVWALERGGFGRLSATGLEDATTGFGVLEVRAFLESPAGELFVGARQGLFRLAWASGEIERLDRSPVRALAFAGPDLVASGGEDGLRLVSLGGAASATVAVPDSWVDDVAVAGATLFAATPGGLLYGPPSGPLAPHPRGGDATRGVLVDGRFVSPVEGGARRLASLGPDGSRRELSAPEPLRRLFACEGTLLGDGPSGLWRLESGTFRLVRPRPAASLPARHVAALAAHGAELVAGFFDGGVATRDAAGTWYEVPGAAWGVNALLSSGGSVWAATLRGAFRIERGRLVPVSQDGAAFSLAATPDGLAVGLGGGVLLPGRRLLSAFHGLPGNQALALASSRAPSSAGALWVGTPSGLGRIEGRRARSGARPGDGRLPNAWVTALLERPDGLWVATWGGGLARRAAGDGDERWDRFAETEGLRVNAGALLEDPSGRLWFGTQGRGLWRSDASRTRFERVPAALPSPDVFSLALVPESAPDTLVAGTDAGLLSLPLERNVESP